MPIPLMLDLGQPRLDPATISDQVHRAEAAGVSIVTFSDGPVLPHPGGLEAGTSAAFVSTRTDRVGLAPQLHVTTTEPFHLATQLASLDHHSKGRGAWLVGAANDVPSLRTVGADPLDQASLRQEVRDVIAVTRLLWDSWQDDAVIKDIPTGRYLDADRVHHVDFTGAHFTVKGPLITPRPPQGQLVIIAPADLDVDDLVDIVLIPDDDHLDARVERARAAGALAFADVAGELDTAVIEHVDGIRLSPAEGDFEQVLQTVVPALDLQRPTQGATLRESLGLTRPANHFATA